MTTAPHTFRVQRAANIQAAPEAVFALVNNFRKWHLWSPYEKLDPAMKKTYSGPASGRGAIYEWSGNRKAGQGRMEIIETVAPSRIVIQLDFLKPFEGHNIAEFTLEPKDGATNIVWSISGPKPFFLRLMKFFSAWTRCLARNSRRVLPN
jgi:hypothetical protein